MRERLIKISISFVNKIKNLYTNLSFQSKLIFALIFSISVFVTLSAFISIQNIQSNIDNQVLKLNYNLKSTQILANQASQLLILNYRTSLIRNNRLNQLIEDTLSKNKGMYFILITDNAGNILASSKYTNLFNTENKRAISPPRHVPYIKTAYTKNGKILIIAEPIQYISNFFGWVWIGFPDQGFTLVGSKKELTVFLLEIFLLVWILSVIGAIVNSVIITRPLRKLEKSAKAITEGRFGFQLPLKGFLGKELSQLVKAFNKMSKRLKQYEESNIASISLERNKLESVIMSIADGVIVFDGDKTVQIVNHTACDFLEKSPDELLGANIKNIFNFQITEKIFSYLKNLNLETNEKDIEHLNIELISQSKNLRLIITHLDDTNSESPGTVIVMQDRTKETEIEQLKQEFISNVSHELRTPITSIKCYVDTICSHNEQLDENTRNEFLSIVNEETDRLSNLVNDVLELSRLESPTAKINLSLQLVYPSIEYALKATHVLANKKLINLMNEVEEKLPQVNINQEYLERILVNLISNAIKYTPANGTVKLKVKKENNLIIFQVIDNGIGIQEEFIPYIFERFYRIENKVHTQKGTGLGLTIVKKSIEQHGGIISVQSKLGEGSVFEFTVPISNKKADISEIKDFKKESKATKTA